MSSIVTGLPLEKACFPSSVSVIVVLSSDIV